MSHDAGTPQMTTPEWVEYWHVGARHGGVLQLSQAQISAHLLADWMPSLPPSINSGFMGWPLHLLEGIHYRGRFHLCLCEGVGQTERQWKGFLSWMLGVAGTRQVLQEEGYRWIAPVSAFHYAAKQPVYLGSWPSGLQSGVITTKPDPSSSSRLMPDYLAVRSSSRGWDCAAVESKGTRKSLSKRAQAPDAWLNQAHNIQLLIHGVPATIRRHVVVATRVSPNALGKVSRRVQIRAWNSSEGVPTSDVPDGAVSEIVAAHLYGVFNGARLFAAARMMAASVDRRRRQRGGTADVEPVVREGLEQLKSLRTERPLSEPLGRPVKTVEIEMDAATAHIEMDQALIDVAEVLGTSESDQQVAETVRRVDLELDNAEKSERARKRSDPDEAYVNSGVRLRLAKRRA